MLQKYNARGLAVAYFDKDGDVDIALSVNRAPPLLLRNETLLLRIGELRSEAEVMEKEIRFLEDTLKDLENGVVACWKRPESLIPAIAGTIVIRNFFDISVVHHSGRRVEFDTKAAELSIDVTSENREKILELILADLFEEDMNYASLKNCYIRVSIENHTSSYALYRNFGNVLKKIGIVLVNE